MRPMMAVADALAHGWRLHQAGDYAHAERAYRDVLAREPGSILAWHYLALTYYDQGLWEDAEAACRQAMQLRANVPEILNTLGSILTRKWRPSEAIAYYD